MQPPLQYVVTCSAAINRDGTEVHLELASFLLHLPRRNFTPQIGIPRPWKKKKTASPHDCLPRILFSHRTVLISRVPTPAQQNIKDKTPAQTLNTEDGGVIPTPLPLLRKQCSGTARHSFLCDEEGTARDPPRPAAASMKGEERPSPSTPLLGRYRIRLSRNTTIAREISSLGIDAASVLLIYEQDECGGFERGTASIETTPRGGHPPEIYSGGIEAGEKKDEGRVGEPSLTRVGHPALVTVPSTWRIGWVTLTAAAQWADPDIGPSPSYRTSEFAVGVRSTIPAH